MFTENTPIRVQEFIRNLLQEDPDDRGNFVEGGGWFPLFDSVYRLVLEDMDLTEEERQVVENYVASIEHDEEELL